MPTDPRILLLFAANALLLFLTGTVNNGISGWSVHLFLAGPMVVLPALYLRFGSALATALLSGAWLDTGIGTPFGFFAGLFAIATTVLYHYRIRFRAENNAHPLLLAHVLNPVLFLLLLTASAPSLPGPPAYWIRGIADLLASQAVLALVAPWFFGFERMLFNLFHVDSEPADRPLK